MLFRKPAITVSLTNGVKIASLVFNTPNKLYRISPSAERKTISPSFSQPAPTGSHFVIFI